MTTPFTTIITVDDSVPVPSSLLEQIIPAIHDVAELQVLLAVVRLAASGRSWSQPVSLETLRSDAALRRALRNDGSPRSAEQAIQRGLELSLIRGTLIEFQAQSGKRKTIWYYLNTSENRALVTSMEEGRTPPPVEIWSDENPPHITIKRPSPLTLYEQNIGPLTPLIADQMLRSLEVYPRSWIEDAILESVAYNRRSWRYIQRILENWQTEGRESRGDGVRGDATHRRDHSGKSLDPEKYRGGEHLKRARNG